MTVPTTMKVNREEWASMRQCRKVLGELTHYKFMQFVAQGRIRIMDRLNGVPLYSMTDAQRIADEWNRTATAASA